MRMMQRRQFVKLILTLAAGFQNRMLSSRQLSAGFRVASEIVPKDCFPVTVQWSKLPGRPAWSNSPSGMGKSGLHAVIDDIIDTAGTLVKTAEALLENGATKVFAACTHPVLSGPAVDRIMASQIEEVIVTDSVPLNEAAQKVPKIRALSVAPLLARGIQSIHEETSISELFM